MTISSISSFGIMQLFEMIFLLDSYSRRSLPGFKILRLELAIRYVYKDLIWRAELSLCRFLSASYCCRWLQIVFISGLFFDSDCFFDYTRLSGRFLERPGKLTGPKSDFEIKISRKVGCVLNLNKVHFVSLANNFTV